MAFSCARARSRRRLTILRQSAMALILVKPPEWRNHEDVCRKLRSTSIYVQGGMVAWLLDKDNVLFLNSSE